MWSGVFALMERSLRIDARTRSVHLLRLGLIGAIYLSLCQTMMHGSTFGAPGLNFFRGIAFFDQTFMTLLGIGFFSSVITEEKEEDTLGLMLMTGISPLGILTGKSVGGLWQAMLMIAVQYPFGVLAVTLGGVTPGQVWSVTVALLAYTVFLSCLGLFCSTISATNNSAAWRTAAGVILYVVMPVIAWTLFQKHTQWLVSGGAAMNGPEKLNLPDFAWALLQSLSEICIFLQMETILATNANESALTAQVISNVAMAVLFFGLARLFFGISTRRVSSEPVTRGLVARRKGVFRFPAGRTWANPFLWKDFHFVSGGVGMTVVRTVCFMSVGLIPFAAELFSSGPPDRNQINEWIGMSICLTVFLAIVSVCRVLARSMQDEIRGQTLSSLMMLPCSTPRIVYSKYAGALLGCLPGPVIAPLMLFTSRIFRENFFQAFDHPLPSFEPYHFLIIAAYCVIVPLLFALAPHFAAYFALHMRWGAVPWALAMAYIAATLIPGVAGVLLWSLFRDRVTGVWEFAVVAYGLYLFCLCAACHLGIMLKVEALAAK
jgi:ABC-type Na+ efflux pump permease subunit